MTLARWTAILALAALPGAAQADEGHEHEEAEHGHDAADAGEDGEDHLATLGDVRLLHAWTRATGEDTALAFVEIENTGDSPVMLTGAESPIAERVELVGFRMENGTGGYEPLPGLPVAPGTAMILSPEGLALRLAGLSRDLEEGGSFPIEIVFEEGHLDMTGQVEAADARQHSHAGHAH